MTINTRRLAIAVSVAIVIVAFQLTPALAAPGQKKVKDKSTARGKVKPVSKAPSTSKGGSTTTGSTTTTTTPTRPGRIR